MNLFVRSDVIKKNGQVANPGEWQGHWTSRAYTIVGFYDSFYLYFNTTGVNPSGNNVRFWGFPLRCLVW